MQKSLSSLTPKDVLEEKNVLIESLSMAKTKKGKDYLKLTVRDKSTSLEAKLWDFDETKHSQIKTGEVCAVWATVDEWNGKMQLNIKEIESTLEDPMIFAKNTEFSVPEMWENLLKAVDTFAEPMTKYVTEEILLQIADKFQKAPAAKTVHNAWYGGLLEHVWHMVQMADPIILHYQTQYVPELSRDKVLFGLIMHDAGKIVEYDINDPAFNFSPVGVFTNHIVLGPAWTYEKANQWYSQHRDSDDAQYGGGPMSAEKFKLERAHLMHILAAHHGQLEWGSPVKPASLEAILVHHIDNLDASAMHAIDMIKDAPGPVKQFSNRSFFAGSHIYQYK
jgi:3'-5' exoribonuclease